MAALMRLRVIPSQGEPYEVSVGPKVIVAAERQFAKPFTQILGQDMSFEALCWTAWKATHVSGLVVKPFDEWLDDIDMIEAVDEPRVPLGTA